MKIPFFFIKCIGTTFDRFIGFSISNEFLKKMKKIHLISLCSVNHNLTKFQMHFHQKCKETHLLQNVISCLACTKFSIAFVSQTFWHNFSCLIQIRFFSVQNQNLTTSLTLTLTESLTLKRKKIKRNLEKKKGNNLPDTNCNQSSCPTSIT